MFGSEGMDEFLVKAPGFMRRIKEKFDSYRGIDISSEVVRDSIKEETFEEVIEFLDDLGVPVNDETVRGMINNSLERILCKFGVPETMLIAPAGLIMPPNMFDIDKTKPPDCDGDCDNCFKHE